jgi:hypothetical protein
VVVAVAVLTGCNAQAPEVSSESGVQVMATASPEVGKMDAGVSGSVTGSAIVQFFPPSGVGLRRLTFAGVKHQDGSVTGEWNIVVGATILHGDIDCMTILPGGDRARIAGIVTDAKFTTFQTGTAFAIEVVDNGEGQNDPADATTELVAFRNAPPEVGRLFCETGEAPSELEFIDIELGNVQVHAE